MSEPRQPEGGPSPVVGDLEAKNAFAAGTQNFYAASFQGGGDASPPPAPTWHNLPPLVNFRGRAKELAELHREMERSGAGAAGLSQVGRWAHGGVGKTSLAIEYAWRHDADYPGGRYLLRCASGNFQAEFNALAPALGIAPRKTADDTARAIQHALNAGGRGLLIFDNVETPEHWKAIASCGFLPGPKCRRLVTTRASFLPGVRLQHLDRLSVADGLELLKTSRPIKLGETKIVTEIINWLDGLALGLAVVGAYMGRRKDVTWQGFRDSLLRHGPAAIDAAQDDVGSPQDYETRVCQVFVELFASLRDEERRALEYAAMLPQDNIVDAWLVDLLESDATIRLRARPGHDEHPARAVVNDLAELRVLLPVGETEKTLSLHRFLRHRLRERLRGPEQDRQGPILAAIGALAKRRGKLSHEAVFQNPSLRAELKPLVSLVHELRAERPESAASLGNWISMPLRNLGRFQEDRDVLSWFTTEPLPEGISEGEIGAGLSNLALVLQDLGDLAGARRQMERSIAIDEKNFPPDHPTLATRYNNMGHVELAEGNRAEACRMFRRALDILRRHFADDHPHVRIVQATMAAVCPD